MTVNNTDSRTLISLKDVSFDFDGVQVLDRINLDVHEGDYLGIIGPNGGGKTTVVRLMLGIIKPSTGTVELFGKAVGRFREWWKIGYVPQKATHIESRFPFTVSEVVALGRVSRVGLLRRFGERDREAVRRALEQVHMGEFKNRLVTELSGGQQQRVFIAKALVSDPEILILDEPTVGVDLQSQKDFYQLLARLNSQKGITLVVVSHDVDVIATEVNNVACVNRELVHHCEPKEFMEGGYLDELYGHERKFIVHRH